ncbi:hypothetical protein ACIRRH_41645 [Kitasatospora sp. NPDC101235]|uniref:hypothetical protein n=1 Tax=Kitasatospora sp. NPDC101235 TaxID=3364101 RepID=UPI003807E661
MAGYRSGAASLMAASRWVWTSARCEGPGCENPLPPRTGRGRRPVYCSQACKSRADRARVKARAAAALPRPAAPAGADVASRERAEGERPATGLSVERQRMLGAADAIRKRAEVFLATVDDDPIAAHAELARRVHVLSSLLITSAREVRDEVRWPGLDADARTAARIREEWDLPDATPGPNTDRGDFPAQPRPRCDAGEAHRSEMDAAAAARLPDPKTPRGETGGTTAGTDERAPLRSVVADPAAPTRMPAVPVPELALGRATGWMAPTDRGLGEPHRDYALGDGLVHLTWPSTPNVQALEQRGRLAGWIEAHDGSGNWTALITGRPVRRARGGGSGGCRRRAAEDYLTGVRRKIYARRSRH